jgi:signal transduction histidine kinase
MDALLPLAQKHGVRLTLKNVLENYYIRADRTRLAQVVTNILSNSIKYNKNGGESIIYCDLFEKNIGRISIADTGVGIPEEKFDNLFKPFDRLGMEGMNIEGTGIGLTIVKRLVESMGGKVGVESKVGEGSTFYIDLPVVKKPEPETEMSEIAFTKHACLDKGRSGTILYIEDNNDSVELVKRMLIDCPNIKLISA